MISVSFLKLAQLEIQGRMMGSLIYCNGFAAYTRAERRLKSAVKILMAN